MARLRKEPWKMTREERKNIELPVKVPDEDTVYIFRKTGKAEIDGILAGGRSGKFWESKGGYPGDFTIIAKSDKRNISWAYVLEHQEEFPRTVPDEERGGLKTVWEKNPDFTEKATIYNNHFQEVGESRTLKDIVAILDSNDNVIYLAPKVELDGLVDVVAKKGALMYAGEALGLGKTGDVNVNWEGRDALKEIGFLLEEHPELAKEIPKEINLLLKGEAYEGIFEELRKARELTPKPWQMTQKQFENVKKKPVDVAIDELEPTHALDIEPGEPTTPKEVPIKVWQDIDTGKYLIEDGHNRVFHARRREEKFIKAIVTPTKRIAEDEVVTAFDILHKNIVKQVIHEGKPVPQEVLRDYPDLTRKVNSNHIIWENEHIT